MSTERSLCRVLLLVSVAACSDPYVIMHEEFIQHDQDAERFIGGSCEEVKDGLATGSGAAGSEFDYSISHTGRPDGVVVVVSSSSGKSLTELFYSQDFLLSGKKDVVKVRLSPDDELRLKSWGGTECEPIRDP